MEKVLVLCYYFPPSNLTASQKAYSWAKYLSEFGYYPIVITRNWDVEIKSKYDVVKEAGEEIRHEKHENYEVYYLPNKTTLQNFFFLRERNIVFRIISKALTFLTSVFQNFSTAFMQNKEIYFFASKYLKQEKGIRKMLITGNPFIFFRMGYLLNKAHKIKWIADYRDMWTTQELHDSSRQNWLFDFLNKIERSSEQKWVGSAIHITSVSAHYASTIGQFVGKENSVIPNGYFHEEFEALPKEKSATFTICYSGTLYEAQRVEILISAYLKFVDAHPKKSNMKLLFLGAGWKKEQKERVERLTKGYEKQVEVTDRVSRTEALTIQKAAHLLLLFPYDGATSVMPSKLYEYIGLKVPVLMVPGDGDVVDRILQENGFGEIANTVEETELILQKAYNKFEKNKSQTLPMNENAGDKYTRKYSTKLIADILNKI